MATGELFALLLGRAGSDGTADPAVNLAELSKASPRELSVLLQLTDLESLRLNAAFAMGRRVEEARREPRLPMRSAESVFRFLIPRLRGLGKERFYGLLLDGKHQLLRLERVSEGTLTTSLVHPREVFRPAIREGAAAVVVAHNHPSGDPEPSSEDLEVTRRLLGVGRLLGIPLVDHVVVGEKSWVSLRERMAFT